MIHLRFDFNFIELRQQLAFLDPVPIIHQQLFHDAAGFRLHLHLDDRRDLTRRHHALRQVALFYLGELCGINLGAAARGRKHTHCDQQDNRQPDAAIYKKFAPLFLTISVSVHDRLLRKGSTSLFTESCVQHFS